MAALCTFLLFTAYSDNAGEQRLADVVARYPSVSSFASLPKLKREQIGHWLFTTPDSAEAVAQFYREVFREDGLLRSGWSQTSEFPALKMTHEDGRRLDIYVSESINTQTTVAIEVWRPEPD